MDDRRLAELARLQGGVVTSVQLRECGLSSSGIRHRVRAARLFRERHGAYRLSPHADPRAALWAAVLTVGAGKAALGHWTAVDLHGMAGGRRPSSTVHLMVPGAGGRSGSGLHVHGARSLAAGETVVVDGLRVTSPARTVLDVAGRADDGRVVRLIREGEFLGLLGAGDMARMVAAHPRHPGAPRVRRVDPDTAEAALAQTPIEDELEGLIRTMPLPFPVRQLTIRGASGAPYRLDFGWSATRIAAEADGRSAHQRASSMHTDRFRDNDLAAVGWQTMRFTRIQIVRGADDTRAQILGAAISRGWRPAG